MPSSRKGINDQNNQIYSALIQGASSFLIFYARKLPVTGPGNSLYEPSLPRLVLLESKDQNDPTDQAGDADKLLAFYRQSTAHEEYLGQDQQKGKDDNDNLANKPFRLAFQQAEDGDEGEENSHKRCHRI